MGIIHNNFLSWWQLQILITGQPDTILRDLKNSKGSRELSATLMESGQWSETCNESCVFTLYVGVLGQGMRYSNVTASLLPQPTLLAKAMKICRLVIPLLNAASRGQFLLVLVPTNVP